VTPAIRPYSGKSAPTFRTLRHDFRTDRRRRSLENPGSIAAFMVWGPCSARDRPKDGDDRLAQSTHAPVDRATSATSRSSDFIAHLEQLDDLYGPSTRTRNQARSARRQADPRHKAREVRASTGLLSSACRNTHPSSATSRSFGSAEAEHREIVQVPGSRSPRSKIWPRNFER
jgi:hypothetical protein